MRKCDKCGWVIPATSKLGKCPVCHTYFTAGSCRECRTHTDKLVEGKFCRKCYSRIYNTPINARWRAANRQTNNNTFEAWCAKIQAVPKDYPTLTTEQWLEACAYFGGCAICGDESIDSRVYFVPFSAGGRYCDWNVIPLCMNCTTHYKQNANPFIRLEKPADRQAIKKIIQYLEVRLNAASNTG